jgi:hypothetical protein
MADLQRVSAGIFEKHRVVSRTFVIAGTFNAARASPARNRCQPVDLCRAFGPKGNPAGVGPVQGRFDDPEKFSGSRRFDSFELEPVLDLFASREAQSR